jgi:hypothetical protein
MDDKHAIQIPADIMLQIKNLVQQANDLQWGSVTRPPYSKAFGAVPFLPRTITGPITTLRRCSS